MTSIRVVVFLELRKRGFEADTFKNNTDNSGENGTLFDVYIIKAFGMLREQDGVSKSTAKMTKISRILSDWHWHCVPRQD